MLLERRWDLYAHICGKSSYEFMHMASFEDIPGMWSTLNNVPFDKTGLLLHKSKLIDGFSIFQAGVEPMWEDPVNAKGLDLTARGVSPGENAQKDIINAVLRMCGETFPAWVVGVRLVVKSGKHGKLEIWTSGDAVVSEALSCLHGCLGHLRFSVNKHV